MIRPIISRVPFYTFYSATLLFGALLISYLILVDFNLATTNYFHVVVFFSALLIADTKMVQTQARGSGKVMSSRAFDLAMVVIFGPAVAAVMASTSALLRGFVFKTTSPRKAMFNAAMMASACGMSGMAFNHLPWHHQTSDIRFLLPLFIAMLIYSVVNTSLVAIVLSVDRGIPLREIWHRDFRWGTMSILMELPFAATIILLYHQIGIWSLLIYLPIFILLTTAIRALKDMKEAHMTWLAVLATQLEADEPYTHGHSYRVARYSVLVGREMGVSPQGLVDLEYGALMHDIGKIQVTKDIVCKPGRLTENEFDTLAAHPEFGADIAEMLNLAPGAIDLIRHHHERPDGKGYPDKLSGDQITQGAAIVNVCDAFDAMTSNRSYRTALTVEAAISELKKYRGTQFNSDAVDALLGLVNRGEIDVGATDETDKMVKEIQQIVAKHQSNSD
ncbi:MAG: HD domain-containing protein [bacterium]|nr:HD domain-containing protein [bacterium]MCP4799405.1 HD domain-containing protein [bacterium]